MQLFFCIIKTMTNLLIPIVIFTIAAKRGKLKFASIGINTKIFGKKNLLVLIIICIIFSPIDYWIYYKTYYYFRSIFPPDSIFTYHSVIPSHEALRILVAIYFALSAGIVEELYFRGLIYKISGYYTTPTIIYILASSTLFSLVHWEGGISNVLSTFVFGFIAAMIFLWVKNLWPLIIGHIYTDYVWFS